LILSYLFVTEQESLANAKVIARQQCVCEGLKAPSDESTTNLRKEHVCYSVAIFIRLAAIASQIREIPRNFTKIRTYGSSRSSKVIDGVNRFESAYATSYYSLIVTMDVSLTVFEILTHLARK